MLHLRGDRKKVETKGNLNFKFKATKRRLKKVKAKNVQLDSFKSTLRLGFIPWTFFVRKLAFFVQRRIVHYFYIFIFKRNQYMLGSSSVRVCTYVICVSSTQISFNLVQNHSRDRVLEQLGGYGTPASWKRNHNL